LRSIACLKNGEISFERAKRCPRPALSAAKKGKHNNVEMINLSNNAAYNT